MSLDFYLQEDGDPTGDKVLIYVREKGATVGLSVAEWNERNPENPVEKAEAFEDEEVFWRNITHNLNIMADEAGLYKVLWRPDELGFKLAKQLIPALTAGLKTLRADPDKFKKFNPGNGWGDYDGLVSFAQTVLLACIIHPDARVRTSR